MYYQWVLGFLDDVLPVGAVMTYSGNPSYPAMQCILKTCVIASIARSPLYIEVQPASSVPKVLCIIRPPVYCSPHNRITWTCHDMKVDE